MRWWDSGDEAAKQDCSRYPQKKRSEYLGINME
jgi:hypothetical protein